MPTSTRDNFSSAVRQHLAIRAAHFCSNPRCLKLTAGPASDPNRGLQTGHAAHICAASERGPRYDPQQTPAERSAAANGIWLCRECGDLVDKDVTGYSVSELLTWKGNHEAMIAEVRMQGWASSIALLNRRRTDPDLAARVIATFEDRRVFWAAFDVEWPERVRESLTSLRRDLTSLRSNCSPGSPIDIIIAALGKTIRHFFDAVEIYDLRTLRCDSRDPEWRDFEAALLALRKSIMLQVGSLADSCGITIQNELAEYLPQD
jgi:hypothetical protein